VADVAGVIGYMLQTSIPAAMHPMAAAAFPLITTCGSVRVFPGTS
jgi:hypothetical protein